MKPIPVAGPWITQKEIDYVTDAVTHAWYDQAGVYNQRFEAAFAAYIGVPYAVSLPSCTSGLHLALAALGVGPGDEVIVPDLTWIASSAPIDYVGAEPVFADVDPTTWCLSAETVAAYLTPRTKAVIAVDLYGAMPDYTALEKLLTPLGIALIEDAAEGLGARWQGRIAGAWGQCATFSFHGSKTLTTGEGGMLVTSDKALFERILFLRDHGRSPGGKLFWNSEVAFKYKMSSLQAALGLAQLERVDALVERKRSIFQAYSQALSSVPDLSLNPSPPGLDNAYWMVTALFPSTLSGSKEDWSAWLKARGVDTRPFFYPLSSLPAYNLKPAAQSAAACNHAAYQISPRGLNLPCALNLSASEIDYVVSQLTELLKAF